MGKEDLRKYEELRNRVIDAEEVDPEAALSETLRSIFSTDVGRVGLAVILTDLHFFDEILSTPEEIALSNYAKVLLKRIGVWKADNVKDIVDSLVNITFKKEVQR